MDISTLPPKSEFHHSVDLQIRFNDIDILGHLNNTVYFSFFDTGKAYFYEWLLKGEMNWKRVESVIANVDCAYVSPVYFGEEIEVWTRCAHVGEKSFTLQQMIVAKKTGELKAAANTVMVSINPDTMKSVPIPQKWKSRLEDSMNTENQ